MPRKKAEPEVLQEETVQPEITDIEELTPAEQPALEPQTEEPAVTEPVHPYGEDEVLAEEENSEPSEPENCQNQANQRRNPSTIWTSVRSTRISRRSSGRSGTQSMLPSAAEASCAARSSASIPIP